MRYKKSEEEPGERVGLFSIFPETLPYFRSKYTPMHLSLNHPISDLNSYSQETNDEKTRANPTLSDSTKPYLVSQKGKIYNQFLTFCLSKVGRIYSLYKLRRFPPPRPFKVYEPAITQGATGKKFQVLR